MTLPYNKDDLDNAFTAGQRSAEKHNSMSEETKLELKKMGEDITNLKLDVQDVSKDVKYLVKTLEDHVKEEGDYRNKQEAFHKDIIDKKAGKWVESVIIWVGVSLGAIAIGLASWFVKTVFNKLF